MTALQSAVSHAKKEQAKYDNEYNQALVRLTNQAEDRKRREEQRKAYEEELNTREILNTTNVLSLASIVGEKGTVDMFKGFKATQIKEILDVQQKQREDTVVKETNQKRSLAKRKDEEEWAIRDMASLRAVELLEREKVRRSKEAAIAIRKENEIKAQEDKRRQLILTRQQYIDKVLYTNAPQNDYFNQFNTTSR